MRLLIVGGVAGGASAAARARRLSEKAEIVLFERGEYISFANCGLPYHIAGIIPERERLLVQTPASLKKRFAIDVRIKTEVLKIDRAGKCLLVRDLVSGVEKKEPYDALILSPGAAPIRPPLPGIESKRIFTLRNMADMDAIKKAVDSGAPEKAVVVGGGYIGLEMAEALRHRNIPVTLVELLDQVMAPADKEMAHPLHEELLRNGVDLRLGVSVKGFREENGAFFTDLSTGESVRCGLAILAIGVKPEIDLANDAGLAIGERGGIAVDERLQTSDPAIYAVGDAVEVTNFVAGVKTTIPLAGPANRQGRIAADNIFHKTSVYKKTQGTAICKVFGLAAGMTGLNEKSLKRAGIPFEKIHIHAASHAGYFPGAFPISLKLLFDPKNGKILGAQAVGRDGVDKRIDVLAVALRAGMTVFDLEDLELAYAPPYGSAKDPVNYAGFVAANVLRGDVRLFHAEDMASLKKNQQLLDVRAPEEVKGGIIPGAVNIPVDELRARLGELPPDKEYLAYCKVGLRGYLACRILTQNGFQCRNISGGYTTYQACLGIMDKLTEVKKEMKTDTGAQEDSKKQEIKAVLEVDACALQCPGPILRLKKEMDGIAPGEAVRITTTDPGFAKDIEAWTKSTGNTLLDLKAAEGKYCATVRKEAKSAAVPAIDYSKKKTIIVFSNDLDKAIAAFIIANGALAMGSEVTMFFTFWGLNVLRKSKPAVVKKNLVEKMFGLMMPRGPEKLSLSKMNMGGMGALMIKGLMKKKNVASLAELIESAKKSGGRFVACTMSMDLMGIKKEELIDGIEEGGVAMYLANAESGNVNLFI